MDARITWNQISVGCKAKLNLRGAVVSEEALTFGIGRKTVSRFFKVAITLSADDTYSMKLYRFDWTQAEPMTVVAELEGIYFDGLDQALESFAKQTRGRK